MSELWVPSTRFDHTSFQKLQPVDQVSFLRSQLREFSELVVNQAFAAAKILGVDLAALVERDDLGPDTKTIFYRNLAIACLACDDLRLADLHMSHALKYAAQTKSPLLMVASLFTASQIAAAQGEGSTRELLLERAVRVGITAPLECASALIFVYSDLSEIAKEAGQLVLSARLLEKVGNMQAHCGVPLTTVVTNWWQAASDLLTASAYSESESIYRMAVRSVPIKTMERGTSLRMHGELVYVCGLQLDWQTTREEYASFDRVFRAGPTDSYNGHLALPLAVSGVAQVAMGEEDAGLMAMFEANSIAHQNDDVVDEDIVISAVAKLSSRAGEQGALELVGALDAFLSET